jgi:hypothetical protein
MAPVVGRIPRSGSRRAKAHVARACQNCKKAHLSCDEHRPCSRCVSTRKESTCIDVEHKKRGRPRIQPERGSIGSARGPPAITPPTHMPSAAEQYRVLRSQGNMGPDRRGSLPVIASSSQSHHNLDPRLGQGPQSASPEVTSFRFGHQEPRRWRTESLPLVAFLNLDLRILKAMEPLRALIADSGDVRGTMLEALLAPRHRESLRRLETSLREERTQREPTLLPSIFPDESEARAVQHLSESDVPHITQGYNVDHTDTWTFVLPHGRTETFYCRVRLARTSVFFAVMELQRIASASSQTSNYANAPSSDLFAPRSPFSAPRSIQREMYPPAPPSPFARSEPVSPFSSLPGHLTSSLPHGSPASLLPSAHPSVSPGRDLAFGSSSYFPRQPGTTSPGTGGYPPTSGASMQPPPNPSLSGMPGLPRSNTSGREMRRPEPLSNVQLPPIITSAPTTPINSSFFESQSSSAGHRPQQSTPVMTTPQYQQGSGSARRSSPGEDTDEESSSSRKRRRLNIGEIIEK